MANTLPAPAPSPVSVQSPASPAPGCNLRDFVAAAPRRAKRSPSARRFPARTKGGGARLDFLYTPPMPVLDFPAFADALPAGGALIGLDPGSKRIGVAVCDAGRIIASPLDTVVRAKFAQDAARIFALLDGRAAVGIVVGLPRNMDGSEGPSAQSARAFARNLLAVRDLPLLLWDERLSTAAVTRSMIEADASRKRRAEVVDRLAAAYALQGVIDALQERAARD